MKPREPARHCIVRIPLAAVLLWAVLPQPASAQATLQFRISFNGALGGVTIIADNGPGDLNPAPGAVTATFGPVSNGVMTVGGTIIGRKIPGLVTPFLNGRQIIVTDVTGSVLPNQFQGLTGTIDIYACYTFAGPGLQVPAPHRFTRAIAGSLMNLRRPQIGYAGVRYLAMSNGGCFLAPPGFWDYTRIVGPRVPGPIPFIFSQSDPLRRVACTNISTMTRLVLGSDGDAVELPASVEASAWSADPGTAVVPDGHALAEGSSNNTIPWWNVSNRYQQVHDAMDIANAFGSATPTITSIGFRKDGLLSNPLAARSLDAEITLGTTGVSPATISPNFATNLGNIPTRVLPYTVINLPALSNELLPNPPGWRIPFSTPYTYLAQGGHLCWELRHRNATAWTGAACDAWNPAVATVHPNFGIGCVATGQTAPARIPTRSLAMATGTYQNVLTNAPASTAAVFWLGVSPQTTSLPGFCAPLQFLPLAHFPGATDAAGTWDLNLSFGPLVGRGAVDLFGQFAFLDPGLPPWDLGLSDATWISTPPSGQSICSRVWAAGSNAGTGFENAPTGTVRMNTGLVTVFN